MAENVSFQIDAKGIAQLIGRLKSSARDNIIRQSLWQGATFLAGWSKRKRLSGARPLFLGVRSGRLRASITASRTEKTGNNYVSRIGTNVKYAKIHELGFRGRVGVSAHSRSGHIVRAHTRLMNVPARPFLRPALADTRNRETVLNILTQNINKALETPS